MATDPRRYLLRISCCWRAKLRILLMHPFISAVTVPDHPSRLPASPSRFHQASSGLGSSSRHLPTKPFCSHLSLPTSPSRSSHLANWYLPVVHSPVHAAESRTPSRPSQRSCSFHPSLIFFTSFLQILNKYTISPT